MKRIYEETSVILFKTCSWSALEVHFTIITILKFGYRTGPNEQKVQGQDLRQLSAYTKPRQLHALQLHTHTHILQAGRLVCRIDYRARGQPWAAELILFFFSSMVNESDEIESGFGGERHDDKRGKSSRRSRCRQHGAIWAAGWSVRWIVLFADIMKLTITVYFVFPHQWVGKISSHRLYNSGVANRNDVLSEEDERTTRMRERFDQKSGLINAFNQFPLTSNHKAICHNIC